MFVKVALPVKIPGRGQLRCDEATPTNRADVPLLVEGVAASRRGGKRRERI